MAYLASNRPSTDSIGQDSSKKVESTKTNAAFPLPDIGEETRGAGRFTGDLKSGAAHSAAIGD